MLPRIEIYQHRGGYMKQLTKSELNARISRFIDRKLAQQSDALIENFLRGEKKASSRFSEQSDTPSYIEIVK